MSRGTNEQAPKPVFAHILSCLSDRNAPLAQVDACGPDGTRNIQPVVDQNAAIRSRVCNRGPCKQGQLGALELSLANLNKIDTGPGGGCNLCGQSFRLSDGRSGKPATIGNVAEERRVTSWRKEGHGQAWDAD